MSNFLERMCALEGECTLQWCDMESLQVVCVWVQSSSQSKKSIVSFEKNDWRVD